MSATVGQETAEVAKASVPEAAVQGTPKELEAGQGSINVAKKDTADGSHASVDEGVYEDTPTDEELRTLPRVSSPLQWGVYTIAFAELCERFSYYGSAVLYTNFVQRPMPPGSTTGAPLDPSGEMIPGALGMGQRASQGINLFNQFWAYLMPLVGWVFPCP